MNQSGVNVAINFVFFCYGALHHIVCPPEPLLVARHGIHFPCRHCPRNVVGVDGPHTAFVAVRNHAVFHRALQRLHRCFRVEVSQREQNGITHAGVVGSLGKLCHALVLLNAFGNVVDTHIIECIHNGHWGGDGGVVGVHMVNFPFANVVNRFGTQLKRDVQFVDAGGVGFLELELGIAFQIEKVP